MKINRRNVNRNFSGHHENDVKNSWYWSVLLKNYGSYKKAKKAVQKSRYIAGETDMYKI